MSRTLKSVSALALAALMALGATSVAEARTSSVMGGATGCCRQIMQ
jgi:hypothetical protein